MLKSKVDFREINKVSHEGFGSKTVSKNRGTVVNVVRYMNKFREEISFLKDENCYELISTGEFPGIYRAFVKYPIS